MYSVTPHHLASIVIVHNFAQEARVGKEKMEVVEILRKHHVVIRGSNEEGQRFIEALLVSLDPTARFHVCVWKPSG